MIMSISGIIRNESGKAESKVPAIIAIIILLSIVYWVWQYGLLYYKDFFFKTEVEKMCKYDPWRIKKRPEDESRRQEILKFATEYGISFPDQSKEEFLIVGPDPSGRWYTIHYRYKRVVKGIIGKPKVLWFENKLVPK